MSSSDDEPLINRSTKRKSAKPTKSYNESDHDHEMSEDDIPLSDKKPTVIKKQSTSTKSNKSTKSASSAKNKKSQSSKSSSNTKSTQSNTSDQTINDDDTTTGNNKKIYDKPGQRRDTPDELDPFRMFYESLYNETIFNHAMYQYKLNNKINDKQLSSDIIHRINTDAYMYSIENNQLYHTSQDKWKYKSLCVQSSEMSERFMLLHGLFTAEQAISYMKHKSINITSPTKRNNNTKMEVSSAKAVPIKKETNHNTNATNKSTPVKKRLMNDSDNDNADNIPFHNRKVSISNKKIKAESKSVNDSDSDEPLQKKIKRERSGTRTHDQVKNLWDHIINESSSEDEPLASKIKTK